MSRTSSEKTPRCIVVGANGQVGRALGLELRASGRASDALVAAWGRQELDFEADFEVDADLAGLRERGAEVLINCAAMTAVDRCEEEPERAHRINAVGPGRLAACCERLGMGLVHLSTDYVFSGAGRTPWAEDAPVAPASVYGKTKLLGERAVLDAHPTALIVRSAWIFGDGGNFVRTILGAAARAVRGEGPPLRVVDDQRGSPTYARDLARGILGLLEARETGLYHLANSGVASWWELACAAVEGARLEVPIEAVSSDVFPRPAPRPAWSVLDLSRAQEAGVVLPSWREGLGAYLKSPESPMDRAE